MYRIIKIDERELPMYKGKILHVIDKERRNVETGRIGSIAGHPILIEVWKLTCLVEEE